MKVKRNLLSRLAWVLLIGFIIANIIAYFHAYKFTHFDPRAESKSKHPQELSLSQKIKVLLFGVKNPRPENNTLPARPYNIARLKSNKTIETWIINRDSSKGTVILFHGFGGYKSSMLDKSEVFLNLGYNTMLVDFMGSGGSEGNQTTVGYFEAEQVKTSVEYLQSLGEENIYLFGTSMGAVAIMKALNDYQLKPNAIIIECPFGTMHQTVRARFKSMNVPSFPMAGLLVFWGGVQNGFWAFGHKPTEYAKNIRTPTLLLHGEKDERVSIDEINEIFNNLASEKKLSTYPLAGHENYLIKYKDRWTQDIREFLADR